LRIAPVTEFEPTGVVASTAMAWEPFVRRKVNEYGKRIVNAFPNGR
jgi:hypothetical protein